MKEIYKKIFENKEKIRMFPANKKSVTFYDTIYCFNKLSHDYETVKGVGPEAIFHYETFKE